MSVAQQQRMKTFDIKQFTVTFPVMALVVYLTIVPLFALFWGSVHEGRTWEQGAFTFDSYVKVYTDPNFYELFLNSVILAIGGAVLATVSGTLLAALIYRTDCVGRGFLNLLVIVY